MECILYFKNLFKVVKKKKDTHICISIHIEEPHMLSLWRLKNSCKDGCDPKTYLQNVPLSNAVHVLTADNISLLKLGKSHVVTWMIYWYV